MEAAELASSISDQGHSYAMSHCQSRLNAAAQLSEILEGMTQVNIFIPAFLIVYICYSFTIFSNRLG